ncbi:TetR/AcrR family transcriptional regulator [Gordonia soli]|uniref:Putative TetR family transcriptional regulator n=1 Tax=Gordonia soli NBRC 108243 TaxID=1223545 RepID=M0QHT5_9ACTN|nr:putative TetR family transcriptional regulator [Gordonia soli NBRC 108243]
MDSETAREQVVDAADRLFYTHGVKSVGMDRVRDSAGVSLKRIYSMFPSKESLVLAVLGKRTRQWDDGIAAATAGVTGPRAKLLAIFDFLLTWFSEDEFRGCAFINVFGELAAESPAIATAVRDQKASFQQYVETLVGELGGDSALAAQLSILAEGAQTTAAISGRTRAARDARAAAEVLIDQALGSARI